MIPGRPTGEEPSSKPWRLVLGLGNPGADYTGTRHNVGFDTLDLCAKRFQTNWVAQKHALWAELPQYACTLVKPLTFMNRSGLALREAWLHYQLEDPAALFVVTDDFHLPLGGLRMRAQGSTGGHNGLASLQEVLGSDAYPRLRIGVGEPGNNSVEFVLTRFSAAERSVIEETLMTASWAVEDWVQEKPLADLQARYNRRSPQAEKPE